MKILSTYKVKIKTYNHIFRGTVEVYRHAVDFLIDVSSFVWKYYGGYDHDGIVVRIAAMACAARYSSILAYVL